MTGSSGRQVAFWIAGLLTGLVIGLLTIGGAGGVAFGTAIGLAFGIALTKTAARNETAQSDPDADWGPHQSSGLGHGVGLDVRRAADRDGGRP
ncbi:hypothetical protein [Micromonospora sp. NPDC004551]|uniref:hypothetical protein n=1 Tax=Micromonospora sp. NPDC004551 TaxID=3154284 RepID=UPI0033B3615F